MSTVVASEAAASSQPPMILGSAGRSGSTLVRMMLDAHPRIACGPEMKALTLAGQNFTRTHRQVGSLLHSSFGLDYAAHALTHGAQVRALLEAYRGARGKARVAEKTPSNVHHFLPLAYMLPDAVFVQVIRDGRDVVCSLLKQNWVDMATGKALAYTKDPAAAAQHWAGSVRAGRRTLEKAGAKYVELRYEALLADPQAAFAPVLAAFGETWSPQMLEFFESSHASLPAAERASHGEALSQPLNTRAKGRWQREMNEAGKAAFKPVAGPLLIELGYASDAAW